MRSLAPSSLLPAKPAQTEKTSIRSASIRQLATGIKIQYFKSNDLLSVCLLLQALQIGGGQVFSNIRMEK